MPASTTPDVELLWETGDPAQVLEQRFGFGAAGSAGRWVADTLATYWELPDVRCERIVMSGSNALAWLRTPSDHLIAKWSIDRDRFAGLTEMAALTHWLDGQGIPVSSPRAAADGRLQLELAGVSMTVSMSVQRVIEGELLDVSKPGQVRAAGAALARLQDALARYPGAGRLMPTGSPAEPLATQVRRWLDVATGPVVDSTREQLHHLVAQAPADPVPTQLLHRDFRAANILCTGSEVSAIIDFELAGRDHPVAELARAAVLLGTRFRSWGPVSAEVRSQFLDGYQSVRLLTSIESAWWEILLAWHTVLMVPAGDDPTGWGPAALGCLDALG